MRPGLWSVLASALSILLLAALLHGRATATSQIGDRTVILVSIDGFRADYLSRAPASNLRAIATSGAEAAGMRPSYPSKTYPNHYTLVTGLRPDRHGIVDNIMRDPRISGTTFKLSDRSTIQDPRWWNAAEPIWVTAEKSGMRTASLYWPGSETVIRGVRPSWWLAYDKAVPAQARVGQVLQWLDRPFADRPRFITLYFDDVDSAGHDFGPDSSETDAAIARVDTAIGVLVAGLDARRLAADLVIVSDHGMAATDASRIVVLDQLLSPSLYDAIVTGTQAGIDPKPGQAERVRKVFVGRHPHMRCWRKSQLPKPFHYGRNVRIPPLVCGADTGWLIYQAPPTSKVSAGSHGYDNYDQTMRALFLATGPSFRPGTQLPVFDNVDLYSLIMGLLHLPCQSNDGSATIFKPVLVVRLDAPACRR